MEIFRLTLDQMLMMFLMIVVGILISARNNMPKNAEVIVSKLLTYVFTPALMMYNQISECTPEKLKAESSLLLYGLVTTLCAIGIAYPVSRLFIPKRGETDALIYQRNIYKYALTFGNYGFVGNFIVLGVWGNEAFFRYSLYTFLLNIICFSWGLYMLIPKESSAGLLANLKKGLLTPPLIALVMGLCIGLLNLKPYVPDFVMRALDSAGKCQGPVAMLLAGIVIGSYDFRKLFGNKHVYIMTGLRLIVIPGIMLTVLKLIGASETVMIMTLVAFATPIGLNTVVFPATYGGDTKTGASMAMISHALCVITIPLMYLLFIEIL